MGQPRTAGPKTTSDRIAAAEEKRNRRTVREATSPTPPRKTRNVRPRTNFGSRAPVEHYVPGHKLEYGTVPTRRGSKPTSWLVPLVRGEAAAVFPSKRSAERAVDRTCAKLSKFRIDFPIRQVA